MEIVYRKTTKNDLEIIKEMFYHAIFIPDNLPRPSKQIIEQAELMKYYEGWGEPDDLGWIAYTRDMVVGAAWIRLLRGNKKGYGYIDEDTPELSIAVLPEHRNRGIGSKLIKMLLDEASNYYERISLSVSKENPALRLYKRLGFEEIAENSNDKIMIKSLRKTNV